MQDKTGKILCLIAKSSRTLHDSPRFWNNVHIYSSITQTAKYTVTVCTAYYILHFLFVSDQGITITISTNINIVLIL